jgi:hypothetical protein
MDGGWVLRRRGQQTFQCRVGSSLALEQSFFQHGRKKIVTAHSAAGLLRVSEDGFGKK